MCNRHSIDQINAAVGAHGAWKMRLRGAIRSGRGDIRSHDASADNRCEFGKWLYGPQIDAATRQGVPYQVIRRLHGEFHRSAGRVLAHIEAGRLAEAELAMNGEFTETSEKLTRAMTKWKGELQASGASLAA